jgi:hypothetical protein
LVATYVGSDACCCVERSLICGLPGMCCNTIAVLSFAQEVPGFTWCPKGCERRITHLVLGDSKPNSRTEKVSGPVVSVFTQDVTYSE